MILFLNSKIKECGVYQYGVRLYNNIKNEYFIYHEVECVEEYQELCNQNFSMIIYNYHPHPFKWLINIQKKVLNIGILHECSGELFEICLDTDCTSLNGIPRPLFYHRKNSVNDFILAYRKNEIPIFGSFGFATGGKGFDKVISLVNEQYDNAVIKLIITDAFFNNDKSMISNIRKECEAVPRKQGIILMITHQFFEDNELLSFLESTTCNIFMYYKGEGRGISSVLDYVLSCSTPFAISDSFMFRHVYDDSICVYHRSIKECIKNSLKLLTKFQKQNSRERLLEKFYRFFPEV
jgi:hypothetical protein